MQDLKTGSLGFWDVLVPNMTSDLEEDVGFMLQRAKQLGMEMRMQKCWRLSPLIEGHHTQQLQTGSRTHQVWPKKDKYGRRKVDFTACRLILGAILGVTLNRRSSLGTARFDLKLVPLESHEKTVKRHVGLGWS